ncbi:MAG: type II toxin-antitoxin system RelE/ParE family toxin [Planctomycetales bacterium]|nr:type II toxin-antitoxin system RelE/ParE family toxin [Planctomycetales bacterium]
MTRVVVCSAAEGEYTHSLRWYADRSPAAADAFDNEFDRALSEISANPSRFPHCDSEHQFYLMKRYPFRIIYRVGESEVLIIAVAHTSRDPEYWKGR